MVDNFLSRLIQKTPFRAIQKSHTLFFFCTRRRRRRFRDVGVKESVPLLRITPLEGLFGLKGLDYNLHIDLAVVCVCVDVCC